MSAKTAKTGKAPEGVEEEITTLDGEIQRLEAERAELEAPAREMTWDELVANSAEFEARQRRRGILPRIIHAGRVRRLELEKRRHEEHAASLRAELEAKYEAFQVHEAKLRQAKEERDSAHGQWTLTLSAVQSAEERARRTQRELRELRELRGES